jgi:hypothetical protein
MNFDCDKIKLMDQKKMPTNLSKVIKINSNQIRFRHQ